MSNAWAFNLETLIFSKVKANGNQQLKSKYPGIVFTTSDRTQGLPNFPTVYLHETSSREKLDDLDGTTINAVDYIIQVEVITDTSQNDARYIMGVVADILKGMRFSIKSMPEFSNGNTYYRTIMRCQRLIGSGEKL